jgi:hypothetical protein
MKHTLKKRSIFSEVFIIGNSGSAFRKYESKQSLSELKKIKSMTVLSQSFDLIAL